jgi:DNA-binding response OmpR family regulator
MSAIPKKSTVLLVGESLREQELQKATFSRARLSVLIADNVREAFCLARRHHPDVIVSEFDLPGISGLELCRMIREDIHLRAMPFIFVGESYLCNAKISEALTTGADDYIPSHFDPQYLLAKIKWLIDKGSTSRNLKDYYETVRTRHLRITSVVKETSVLMRELDSEYKNEDLSGDTGSEFQMGINERIDLGIGMIGAIADLVEEQTRAWDAVLDARPPLPAPLEHIYAA